LSGLGADANVVLVQVPDPETLLQEQIAYYRARAPEYDNWWLRTGPYESDESSAAAGRRARGNLTMPFVRSTQSVTF